MSQQAVILAGGKGTRLGKLTADTPKPLLRVRERPFVEYLLHRLRAFGFGDVILLVGPFAEIYQDILGRGERFGLKLHFLPEPAPRGTAGALREAAELLDDTFLLLNGDSFFEFDYGDLAARAPDRDWVGGIALRRAADTSRYGRVVLNADRIVAFAEKAQPGPGVTNAGLYWLRRSVLGRIPPGFVSLEGEILPDLAREGFLYGHVYDGRFIDIGTPEDLRRASAVMREAISASPAGDRE
jgi:NDP-sugar pyrophosphorylase family protein